MTYTYTREQVERKLAVGSYIARERGAVEEVVNIVSLSIEDNVVVVQEYDREGAYYEYYEVDTVMRYLATGQWRPAQS